MSNIFLNNFNDEGKRKWEDIKRGKIKEELRRYLKTGEMIGKVGKELKSIPIKNFENPTMRHDPYKTSGIGQGEGDIGAPVGSGDPHDSGAGGAGNMPGEHILEVEVPLDIIAEVLLEELELPPMDPKKKQMLTHKKDKYSTISRVGPEGLRHFKRTYKEALKRQIALGEYDFLKPNIILIRSDKRYKSWTTVLDKETMCLMIYIMDISGSMWDEQKEDARTTSYWIDTWAIAKYPNTESIYIVHDVGAKIVDKETFFNIHESGGTVISSAYKEAKALIDPTQGATWGTKKIICSPDDYNIHMFHFSDGDNLSRDDTHNCIDILEKDLLPFINLFGYFQLKSQSGSGQFKTELDNHFKKYQQWEYKVKTTEIENRESILDGLKDVFGKGKGGTK